MADTGSILAGFIKGFSGNAVSQMKERDEEERERRKARMLEQLRVDTQKELTLWEESRPGYQEDLKAKRTRNEAETERLRQDRELFPLDVQYKRQQIEFGAEDQRMQRESHADSLRTNAESRASSRASRSRLAGSGNDSPRSKTNLNARYKAVIDLMREGGANPYELSRAEYQWQEAQRTGKSDKYKEVYVTALANKWSTKARAMTSLPVLDKDK